MKRPVIGPVIRGGVPAGARRRGFTLLETMLAAAIGALIVGACLGVFKAIEVHEQRLRARSAQVLALSRLRLVMQRTFSTLVMSDHPHSSRVVGGAGATGGAGANSNALAAGAAGGAGTARAPGGAVKDPAADATGTGQGPVTTDGKTSNSMNDAVERARAGAQALALTLPARVMLAADPTVEGAGMVVPRNASHTPGPVQRLEVVVSQHPIPARTFATRAQDALLLEAAERRAADAKDDTNHTPTAGTGGDAGGKDAEGALPEPTGRAIRGAFELRPAPPAPEALPGAAPSWTLYWQPLSPMSESRPEEERGLPPAPAQPSGPPVEVASGISYLHWQFFRNRARIGADRQVWTEDLPAFIEVEVATVDGLWANWMFEVDWSVAPEGAAAPAEVPGEKTTAPGTRPTGPGGTGGGARKASVLKAGK